MFKELETNRLLLRRPKDSDAGEMLDSYNSEFVMKFNVMEHKDIIALVDLLEKDREAGSWYIEDKETNKFVGVIYRNRDSLRYMTGTEELSFWIDEKFSQKGLMKEAMKMVIDYLFNEEKLEGITVRVFEDNIASRAFIEKLGFVKEGILSNAVKGYKGIIHNDVLYYMSRS